MSKKVDRHYDTLVEDYENALMRLVIYRMAREDAERLLAEAEALENSGFEVPKELDEKCLRLIKENCASEKRIQAPSEEGACMGASRRRGRVRLRTVLRAVAAAVLAAVLLFCGTYAANKEFRVNVLNFFQRLDENGTWFYFRSDATGEAWPGALPQAGADRRAPAGLGASLPGVHLWEAATLSPAAWGQVWEADAQDPRHLFRALPAAALQPALQDAAHALVKVDGIVFDFLRVGNPCGQALGCDQVFLPQIAPSQV